MRIQRSLKIEVSKMVFTAVVFALVSAPTLSQADVPDRDPGIDWVSSDESSIDYNYENPDLGSVYQEDGPGYGEYSEDRSVDWGETGNLPDESATWED